MLLPLCVQLHYFDRLSGDLGPFVHGWVLRLLRALAWDSRMVGVGGGSRAMYLLAEDLSA